MALKLRPTGLGSGIDKDRPDYTVELWRVTVQAATGCGLS
jgi:hypothetical protein